jgi:hypothetical protein
MALNNLIKKINLKKLLFFIFIFFYSFNIIQVYTIHQNTVKLDRLLKEDFAKIETKDYQNILEGEQYKEVFLKSRLYKKKDEIVLDTSSIEEKDSKYQENQYLHYFNKSSLSNVEKWYNCYFGDNNSEIECF